MNKWLLAGAVALLMGCNSEETLIEGVPLDEDVSSSSQGLSSAISSESEKSSSSEEQASSSSFIWVSLPSCSSMQYSSSSYTALPPGEASGSTIKGRKLVKGIRDIPDLLWDSTEVTQGEFKDLLGKEPWVSSIVNMGTKALLHGERHPAPMNYFDAIRLANARSKAEGLDTVYSWSSENSWQLLGLKRDSLASGYRLPTEKEWNHAYNSPTDYGFYWTELSWVMDGYPRNESDSLEMSDYAVYADNSRLLGQSSAEYAWHEVATKLPNSYGLYDMAGNLTEFLEMTEDPSVYNANVRAKGGDWGSPYQGLSVGSSSATIVTSGAFWGLRLVRAYP